eukprot:gene21121-biopygen20642
MWCGKRNGMTISTRAPFSSTRTGGGFAPAADLPVAGPPFNAVGHPFIAVGPPFQDGRSTFYRGRPPFKRGREWVRGVTGRRWEELSLGTPKSIFLGPPRGFMRATRGFMRATRGFRRATRGFMRATRLRPNVRSIPSLPCFAAARRVWQGGRVGRGGSTPNPGVLLLLVLFVSPARGRRCRRRGDLSAAADGR